MRKHRLKVYKKKSKNGVLWLLGVMVLGLVLGRACQEMLPSRFPEQSEVVLYRSAGQCTERMGFEMYLVGVVAAEMPASFDLEALKAQAVCARTYTYQRLLNGYTYPLGADVSDDPGSCQAYISEEDFALAHPQDTEMYYEKVRQAVMETAGEILVYKGEPVEALYHSTCGGQTEEAEAVWGKEIPCLHSVVCQWCKNSSYYEREAVFSDEELEGCLGVSQTAGLWIEAKTASGRVQRASCADKVFSGEELRSLLNLPSSWMEVERVEGGWKITTHGFGHGLGLCQFGAGGMAEEGYSYREILLHYYEGAEIYSL